MRVRSSLLAFLVAAIVGLGALGVAGCGSDSDDGSTHASESAAATSKSGGGAMKHDDDDSMKHEDNAMHGEG